MADIFISYSKDERDLTVALARDLEARGCSVWWDTSLLAGDVFEDVIMAELEKARGVIVIWTKASVKSMWVKSEARRAAEAGKLIPMRAPNVATRELPPPFDGYQTDLVDEREKLYASLAKRGLIRGAYRLDQAPVQHHDVNPRSMHGQTLKAATGTLIVRRPSQFRYRGVSFRLHVDGMEIGRIDGNSIKEFVLPAGRILLEAKTWEPWAGSPPLDLEIAAGSRTLVEVRAPWLLSVKLILSKL